MDQAQSDHDLLIALNTKFDSLSQEFRAMSDNGKERLAKLEETKLNKDSFTAFLNSYQKTNEIQEKAIDFLTKWHWIGWGAMTIIQFIIGYYLISHYGSTPL